MPGGGTKSQFHGAEAPESCVTTVWLRVGTRRLMMPLPVGTRPTQRPQDTSALLALPTPCPSSTTEHPEISSPCASPRLTVTGLRKRTNPAGLPEVSPRMGTGEGWRTAVCGEGTVCRKGQPAKPRIGPTRHEAERKWPGSLPRSPRAGGSPEGVRPDPPGEVQTSMSRQPWTRRTTPSLRAQDQGRPVRRGRVLWGGNTKGVTDVAC